MCVSLGLCAVDFDAWDEVTAKRELEELGLNTVLWNGTSDVVSSLDVYYERLFLARSYAMSHKGANTLGALAGALTGSPFERRESAAWKNAEDRLGPGGADFVFAELCPPRLGLPGVSRGGDIPPKYGCDARSALRGTQFEGYLKLEHAPYTVQANPHFNRNVFVATDLLCERALHVENEDMLFNDDEVSAISTGAHAYTHARARAGRMALTVSPCHRRCAIEPARDKITRGRRARPRCANHARVSGDGTDESIQRG